MILIGPLLGMAMLACGGRSEVQTRENETLKMEILAIDSTSAQVDEIKGQIDASMEKLDELLNDL